MLFKLVLENKLVTFLHPLKMQFRRNPNIPNDNPLPREYLATIVFSVSHQTGEILTFENYYPI